jgi:hypothetical protein
MAPPHEGDAKRTHLLGLESGHSASEKTNPLFSNERFRRPSSRDGVKTNPFHGSVADTGRATYSVGEERLAARAARPVFAKQSQFVIVCRVHFGRLARVTQKRTHLPGWNRVILFLKKRTQLSQAGGFAGVLREAAVKTNPFRGSVTGL